MKRSDPCNTEFTNYDKHEVIKEKLGLSPAQTLALFGRQVAYNKYLAIAGGSVGAGVFLAQLLHWIEYLGTPDAWIYKTAKDWWQETALSQHELPTIRKALIARGILEEKLCGVPAKLHYKLNWEQFDISVNAAIRDHAAGVNKREAPKNKFSATPKTAVLGNAENKNSGTATSKFAEAPETIGYEIEDKKKNETTKSASPAPAKRKVAKRRTQESSSSFFLQLALDEEGEGATDESVQQIHPSPETVAAVAAHERRFPQPPVPVPTPVRDQLVPRVAVVTPETEQGIKFPCLTVPTDDDGLADKLAAQFGLSDTQKNRVALHIAEGPDGRAFVLQCAEITLSKPRENLGRAFAAAMRDGWKKPISTVPTKSDIAHGRASNTETCVPAVPETQKDYTDTAAAWAKASKEEQDRWMAHKSLLAMRRPQPNEKPSYMFLSVLHSILGDL